MVLTLVTLNAPAFSISLPPATPASTEPDPATVKAAIKDFNSLSKKEKKERVKEVKKAVKKFNAEKKLNSKRYWNKDDSPDRK